MQTKRTYFMASDNTKNFETGETQHVLFSAIPVGDVINIVLRVNDQENAINLEAKDAKELARVLNSL